MKKFYSLETRFGGYKTFFKLNLITFNSMHVTVDDVNFCDSLEWYFLVVDLYL